MGRWDRQHDGVSGTYVRISRCVERRWCRLWPSRRLRPLRHLVWGCADYFGPFCAHRGARCSMVSCLRHGFTEAQPGFDDWGKQVAKKYLCTKKKNTYVPSEEIVGMRLVEITSVRMRSIAPEGRRLIRGSRAANGHLVKWINAARPLRAHHEGPAPNRDWKDS